MQVTCTTLWLPKDGNSREEYEDAAFPSQPTEECECAEFSCAVADGATETSFSGLWADLLVRGYVAQEAIAETRKKWQEQIPSQNLPWYVEEKASSGAFAALVGLTVRDDGGWHSEAVGDSCLIQIRQDSVVKSFPIETADQFNNRPFLISSKAPAEADPELIAGSGGWLSGDKFLLLTDAIARWVLTEGSACLHQIWQLRDEADLQRFVAEQRSIIGADLRPKLHNDDLTIMRLEIK